jgi:hypothetical protein
MIRFALLLSLAHTGPAGAMEQRHLSPDGKHWEWVDQDRGQWRLNPGVNNG